MSVVFREMRADEVDAVATMVQGLARDIGASVVPRLTGAVLSANRDLIDVEVADDGGRLIGACLTLMTFSTWRGARGAYVVDLFVESAVRGRNIGLLLLRHSAARAALRGATFIKLEVDRSNDGAARFYRRLGFAQKDEDRLFVLEHDKLEAFVKGKETQ